jgi:hypothetical protein
MLFKSICYILGLSGGSFLIISGIYAGRDLTRKSVSSSLKLAGVCSVIWSVLGAILCWSNIIPQVGELVKMLVGGITAGILINMVLSGQINGLTLNLFSKRSNSATEKENP